MHKKTESTFDKFMKDKHQKELFNKEYSQFLLAEFLLEAMKEKHLSVRKLSEKSGVSTSIIQNIKAEKVTNITLSTLEALASSLGYRICLEKIDS